MFICFEGIDGCGKTTQVKMLQRFLVSLGFDVIVVREPGGTWAAEDIRDILHNSDETLDDLNPVSELLLFNAARSELVSKVIIPHLNKPNSIVIADRYIYSTFAYQGYGRGINLDTIKSITDIATNGLVPDVVFLLSVTLEVSKQRKFSRMKPGDLINKWDVMPDDFYHNVIRGYVETLLPIEQYMYIIDANPNEHEVFDNISQNLQRHPTIKDRFYKPTS